MATPVDKDDDDIFSHTILAPPPTIVVTSEDVPDEGFIAKLKKRGKFVTFKRLFSHTSRHHNDKQCESPSTPLEPIATRRLSSLVKRRSMESLDELFLDPCECDSIYYMSQQYIESTLHVLSVLQHTCCMLSVHNNQCTHIHTHAHTHTHTHTRI